MNERRPVAAKRTAIESLPVSVVVPAFNAEATLARALGSVAAQHPYPVAEVVVVDDASRDRTAATASELGATVVRQPSNQGVAAARNAGIAAVTTPWVAFLDADDEWLPHHLATLWEARADHAFLAGSALTSGLGTASEWFDGPVRRGERAPIRSPRTLLVPENFVPASGAMLRTELVRAVGGLRGHRGVLEDLDLWVRLLERGTGLVLPIVTVRYHVHPGQISSDPERMGAAWIDLIETYSDRAWWSASLVERVRGVSALAKLRSAVRTRDPRAAIRAAATILARPARTSGALELAYRHLLLRRRGAQYASGGPDRIGRLR